MNFITKIGVELLYTLGISQALRKSAGRFVLVFHGVSAERMPKVPAYAQPQHSADELCSTLEWLGQYYRFISPAEFFAGEDGLLLSFDDGFANNFTNALPVLEEFNAPAIFFVATQHVENPLNWFGWIRDAAHSYWGIKIPPKVAEDFYNGMSAEQVIAAAKHPLITIGAHTHSHRTLTEISAKEVDFELGASRDYLENLIQKPVQYFAYPKGQLNARIARQVENAGYHAAFSLREMPREANPNYAIPRVDLYYPSPAYLTLKLSQKPL